MSEPEQGKHEQPAMPPMDPRLLAAMYGMPEEDEIDLLEYWRVIWKNKMLIVLCSLGVGILAAGYSLTLPNIYKAEVLLAPISDDAAKAPSLGGFGGLASLAGISMGGGGNVEENLAVLKSREFLWAFIREKKLMPVLFKDDWDAGKGAWKDADPEKQPTLWSAFRALTGVLHVASDKKTGLVTVAIEWTDAKVAAEWANALVAKLNEYLRQRAISESAANLHYLKRELVRTRVEDMRQALFSLISKEQKKAMLASSRKQFAFRVLDVAVPPDQKIKPKRALIVVLATFVAGFMAVLFVFIREGIDRKKAEFS